MNVMHGKRALIAGLVVALAVCAAVPHGARAVDFLIPGMSLESVSLVPGERVSYLVTSASFGAIDSSYVDLRVVDRAKGTFLLEIVTCPHPRSREGSTAIRLRLAEQFTSAASPEAFRSHLREVRIREGAGAFRAPTERELHDLELERLFIPADSHAQRSTLQAAQIATPAGSFLCDGFELARKERSLVSLGGVEAERSEEETSKLWTSRRVPLWGLVKSTVVKSSFTEAHGVRRTGGRPRVTVTESVLLSYKRVRSRP